MSEPLPLCYLCERPVAPEQARLVSIIEINKDCSRVDREGYAHVACLAEVPEPENSN
jgi:hypothetical protein